MTTPKIIQAFGLDIRNAELEGLTQLFANWNAERRGERAQAQWCAIVKRLNGDKLMTAFCAETGVVPTNLTSWESGDNLPSEQVCAIYINLLIRKTEEELSKIAEERRNLTTKSRKSSAKKKGSEAYSLPEQTILSFELPEAVPAETTIKTLDGYDDLPGRTKNCLENDKIVTAKALASPIRMRDIRGGRTWQEAMLEIPNLGQMSLAPLYHFMVNNGFQPTLGK